MIRKDILLKTIIAAIVALFLFTGIWWLSIKNFAGSALHFDQETVMFTIAPGSGLKLVANRLEKEGIIDRAGRFVWLARLQGHSRAIKTGEYEFGSGISPAEILELFVAGKVKQYSLTVIEGWTFQQMMEAINQHPKLSHTLQGKNDSEIMAAIGHSNEHPEGRFLPDTYLFPLNTSDVEFLKRAYREMEKVLTEAWAQRQQGLPYNTAYESLVMASIVEKETSVPQERNAIAGVFVSRLKKRMRLQTDPTVIYGMGEQYKGNITKKDLRRDTPYNTYRRRGLPPTPIALPSKEAILAALNPDDSEYLYFVAKGDGSHHFSKTVKEHNKAVRKYQIRQRKRDYRSFPKEN